MSALYLYAVLDAPAPPAAELRGVASEPLRIVPAEGLFVAAGGIDRPPPARPAELRRHDAVVRALAASCDTLLPLRFGQTAPDEDALRTSVARSLGRLRRGLDEVRGARQMTLRLFGPAPCGTAPAATRAEAPEPAGSGPGTVYLRDRLRARVADRTPPPELEPLLARVAPLVRAQRVERPPGGNAALLRATVYHLVEGASLRTYLTSLRAALRELPGPSVSVRASGPFPPYAFGEVGSLAPAGELR